MMTSNPMLPLAADHRNVLVAHFACLPKEDLRLRFGHTLSLPAIETYVNEMDFDHDGVFGVFDAELQLAGVAHVALMREAAEFGVSVLPTHRRRGIGRALFERSVTFARNCQVDSLFVHCLAENRAMLQLARASDMRVIQDSGEVDAWLELERGGPDTMTTAYIQNRFAVFDYALKSQLMATRRIADVVADTATKIADSYA